MKETFHQRVTRLREAKSWSVAKLSKRSGLSEALVNQVETNSNHVPTWLTIAKLASSLNVNPYYLASGEGSVKPFSVSRSGLDVESYSRQTRRRISQ
jgi:transcriptional regulator with XRE-family HTH domain